jgi:hypothetical protein
MMKKLLVGCAVACAMLFASAAHAGLVANGDWATGDETGWTRWRAPWGAGETWAVTNNGPTPPEGTASLNGTTSSFGWFQRIPVEACRMYVVSADWAGNIGGAGWAEVMFFSCTEGLSDGDVINRIDTGNAADIAYKKDSWGMNPPTSWGWEAASLSPHPSGNGGLIHADCNEVVVALKLGQGAGNQVWTSWDNIQVFNIPEPGTMMLLGSGLVGLVAFARRKFLA